MQGQVAQYPHAVALSRDPKSLPAASDHISATETCVSRKDGARNSQVVPLAPLEYLQNQRRGSITDPSLHAAVPNPHMNSSKSSHNQFRTTELSPGATSISRDTQHKLPEPRPESPYVFGDATPRANDATTIRNLLRSPSIEIEGADPKNSYKPIPSSPSDQMDNAPTPSQFDPNMRRHSIATGQTQYVRSPSTHGTKRKISPGGANFPVVGEEVGLLLSGPLDPEGGRLPKRRGSVAEAQNIAQLSLYDQRRNSVDSRGTKSSGRWWLNDRRDATAPLMFPGNIGGYAPASAADSAHGRPSSNVAAVAWGGQPPEQVTEHAMTTESPSSLQSSQRPFEASSPQSSMIPPTTFPSNRRTSPQDSAQPPRAMPSTRAIRSRSRPPSRQLRNTDHSTSNEPNASSGSSAAPDDIASASSSPSKSAKDGGSTPYSRSPELRVSHKLAERKRRKEMKDLFDELRDQLPADRGMKASKWEILSKAIDFVINLKQTHQEMAREIEALRHELDSIRHGSMPPFNPGAPPHHLMYGQAPIISNQYQPPTAGSVPPPPQPVHPQPQISRPASSQNAYSPTGPTQNGNATRGDALSST